MVSVEVYIKVGEEYKRLDLFKDEKISLTSSIQNVNDLSKVFTDYTQSFTVPASKVNNQIFNYWNENAVNDGFDQRVRYDAIIELNTIPFKKGQIQIEKANEKNNRVESFSVTFYGKVKQIKDLFKDDRLGVLDYTSLNHNYTPTEVRNRIDGTTNDGVYYPIVGNQHQYTYGNGGAYDVTIGSSPDTSVVYSDLFPAIPVSKVFEFIENRYDITFTSTLFDTSYLSELYLYCKNSEQQKILSAPERVLFTTNTGDYIDAVNQTNNTFTFNPSQGNTLRLVLKCTPDNDTIMYRVHKKSTDGNMHTIYDNLYGEQFVIIFDGSEFGLNNTIYFEIESAGVLNFSTRLSVQYYGYDEFGDFTNYLVGFYSGVLSTTSTIDLGVRVPDIKVVDFFNGIIKLFNLTITATSETSFNLEPLEFYYAYGDYIDINSYVINDSVDLERTKLFKKLSFSHEKSDNILNNYFRNTFQRGYDYGDLIYEDNLSNESNTYEIKTPFENVMWERVTDENFLTTSLIDKDLKPYKPKPILMYKNNLGGDATDLNTAIKLFDGTNYNDLIKYVRFSNELFINNDIASLNFNEEQSSWNLSALASDSLFALWYRNYISGLYDIRCRIVKLKAIMPITKLSDIKLNDKIVYKDKKYIINQFTADLTSGEVDFELISDFRAVTNSANGTDRFALKQIFTIDNTAQDLEVTILKLNSEYYDVAYAGTSYESLDNYADGTFIIPIDDNTTGDYAYKQIEITYHNPDLKQYINIIQNA
jgi:hypothetical protein